MDPKLSTPSPEELPEQESPGIPGVLPEQGPELVRESLSEQEDQRLPNDPLSPSRPSHPDGSWAQGEPPSTSDEPGAEEPAASFPVLEPDEEDEIKKGPSLAAKALMIILAIAVIVGFIPTAPKIIRYEAVAAEPASSEII